jgi:hypothetical protein
MRGNGWGGARVGAGRKPKARLLGATSDPVQSTALLREIPAASLEARVAALEATVDQQDKVLARLVSSRGRYGDADLRVLVEIDEAAAWLTFRAKSIMRRAADVPALRAALDEALIETPQELGLLLGRLRGVAVEGVRLQRGKHQRGGWWWRTVRADQQCRGEVRDDCT